MDYEQLVTAIDSASQALLGRAAKAVNQALVVRNWLIGAHLLEFEQSGQDRATYGERLLSNLSADLKARGLKGLGISMLKNCRQFYRLYPGIRQSLTGELGTIAVRPEIGNHSEADLESALLDHLQAFLLELGTGFCFEARQKRITIGNEHDYIDLLFYHRFLRCHILVDLKIRPFSHQDAGQMNFYLNYFKQKVMIPEDNPPVGVILCSDKDQTKVQFATAGLDNQLFVSRYLVALPSADELRKFVESDREAIESSMR